MAPPPKAADGDEGSRPPTKRVRTDEQLDRKRQADREKHKTNRAESKTQLSNIERDVSQVRAHLDLLLSRIDVLSTPAMSHATPSSSSTYRKPSVGERRAFGSASPWTDTQGSVASDSPATVAPLASLSLPQLPNMPMPMIQACRCGIKHDNPTDCPAYWGVALLYQAHVAMASNQEFLPNLPRSPTMATYMLMDDGNALSKMLCCNMRRFRTKNVETVWAAMFLNYRLFRWRLCPTEELAADVPEFMKATEMQQSMVHPLIIDCVPWPKLRDHLCVNLLNEAAHTIKMYMESFEFMWPRDKSLLDRDEGGNITLHPEFEDYASNLANWHLGSPWREAFPELHHLVSI